MARVMESVRPAFPVAPALNANLGVGLYGAAALPSVPSRPVPSVPLALPGVDVIARGCPVPGVAR